MDFLDPGYDMPHMSQKACQCLSAGTCATLVANLKDGQNMPATSIWALAWPIIWHQCARWPQRGSKPEIKGSSHKGVNRGDTFRICRYLLGSKMDFMRKLCFKICVEFPRPKPCRISVSSCQNVISSPKCAKCIKVTQSNWTWSR